MQLKINNQSINAIKYKTINDKSIQLTIKMNNKSILANRNNK